MDKWWKKSKEKDRSRRVWLGVPVVRQVATICSFRQLPTPPSHLLSLYLRMVQLAATDDHGGGPVEVAVAFRQTPSGGGGVRLSAEQCAAVPLSPCRSAGLIRRRQRGTAPYVLRLPISVFSPHHSSIHDDAEFAVSG